MRLKLTVVMVNKRKKKVAELECCGTRVFGAIDGPAVIKMTLEQVHELYQALEPWLIEEGDDT